MKRIMMLSLAAMVASCTDEDAARDTLMKQGFSDVTTQGYDWTACGKDDATATKFTATNPKGQRVSGVVCCGLGPLSKGCTVRW